MNGKVRTRALVGGVAMSGKVRTPVLVGVVAGVMTLAVVGVSGAVAQCQVQRITTDDNDRPPGWTLSFGAVRVDGDYAVVGASQSTTCIGTCSVSGMAFVFRREGGRWVQEQILEPSERSDTDRYGGGVISGDYIAVSAPGLEAVFVFHRTDEGWLEQTKLVGWDDKTGNAFGTSLAIHGDLIVIGADEDDEAASNAGAAYVFRRSSEGAWEPEQKLLAGDAAGHAVRGFGDSVATNGQYILVGDPAHTGGGRVYSFEFDGSAWTQKQCLYPLDLSPGDHFGSTIALHGHRALIGAPLHDLPAEDIGAVYLFEQVDGLWSTITAVKLTPSTARPGDVLGRGDLNDRFIVLGNPGSDVYGSRAGLAHVFEQSDGTWAQEQDLRPEKLGSFDAFGRSVSLTEDDMVLVGSPGEERSEYLQGAVYMFHPTAPCHSLREVARFQRCFAGEGGAVSGACEVADLDGDADVDLADHREVVKVMVGPSGL